MKKNCISLASHLKNQIDTKWMYNVLCFQSYKTNVSIHEKHKAKQNKNTDITKQIFSKIKKTI